MFSVAVSVDSAARQARAQQFLAGMGADDQVLVLAATREAADDLVRMDAAARPGTLGRVRTTPGQLASRLAQPRLVSRGVVVATGRAMEAVTARAAQACFRDGMLEYFTPVVDLPGFARALAGTLRELRLHDVSPAQLQGLGPAGLDLAHLLKTYEQFLVEGLLADWPGVVKEATLALKAADASTRSFKAVVMLDIPLRSPVEAAWATALLTACPQGLVVVPQGDQESLGRLGEHAAGAVQLPPSATTSADVGRVHAGLFSAQPPTEHTAGENVTFFSAPGESRECVEVVRRILREARAGVPFDHMAVVLRDPETYGALLEGALARAGIPAFMAPGTRAPNPAGRAFLAVLTCAVEQLSAHRFAEYLSMGQVPALGASGAPPQQRQVWAGPADETQVGVERASRRYSSRRRAPNPRQLDLFAAPTAAAAAAVPAVPEDPARGGDGSLLTPWRWEQLMVQASVIGGDRWKRRLAGLGAELEMQRTQVQREDPDSGLLARLSRDIEDLGRLTAFSVPVMEMLQDLADTAPPEGRPWGDWLARLMALAPMVLREPEDVLEVLAELQSMAELGPVRLQEVVGALHHILSTMDRPLPKSRFGRVFVGTPDQVRGRTFTVVWVPGLAERLFPRRVHEDPLLLDHARMQLRTLVDAVVMRTQDARSAVERLQLHLAVGAASGRLHLSWPRVQAPDNRPRVPSFYALDLVRALTGRLPDHRDLEHAAERAGGARMAWPAPQDPQEAIDEVERDLAVLAPLLAKGSVEGQRGAARFFLELNGFLSGALRSRYARWSRSWSHRDGLYLPEGDQAAALAAFRLTQRAYSPTALQRYARCPYQFYLGSVLRLEPRKEAAELEYLDPRTRGVIFHDVQAHLFRNLSSRGWLPLDDAHLEQAVHGVLVEVFTAVADRYCDALAPAVDRVWEDAMAQMMSELQTWLRMVAQDTAWVPWRFELAVGMGLDSAHRWDEHSVREDVTLDGGFHVRGVMDLVERSADGKSLRVTDHKTGADRTHAGLVVGGGEVLQPLLYAHVLSRALGMPVTEGRLFYCTHQGAFATRSVMTAHPYADTHLQTVLAGVDHAVSKGQLLPYPAEARTCTFCDYRDVCGPDEHRRTRRKPQAAMEGLRTIRGLP